MEKDLNKETGQQKPKEEMPYIPAGQAADVYRSPTAAVTPQHSTNYANTGTNVSYEGATAPGGGGSVGTGEASGQPAVGSTITTTRSDESVTIGEHNKDREEPDQIGAPAADKQSVGEKNADKNRL